MLIKSRKSYEVTISILLKSSCLPFLKVLFQNLHQQTLGIPLPGKIQTLYIDTEGALENIKFS